MAVNTKLKKIVYTYVVAACVFFTIACYLFNFYDYPISYKSSDWGAFGDYFGGILNPLIGILNLFLLFKVTILVSRFEKKRSIEQMKNDTYWSIIKTINYHLHLAKRESLERNDFLNSNSYSLQILISELQSFTVSASHIFDGFNSESTFIKDFEDRLGILIQSMNAAKEQNTTILIEQAQNDLMETILASHKFSSFLQKLVLERDLDY